MTSRTGPDKETNINEQDVAPGTPKYDPGIVPAETAARMDREGSEFMQRPGQGDAKTDDQTDRESIDVTGGYTVDKEGLANNYAIEPEMYVNEPGDLRQEETERESLNQEEQGKLTEERDARGKGTGII
ncbi:MAG: hypothetical protein JOZ78_23220 [Chroococcidiopsidaceae cyanobacterium CP_BM_ER_R8_30]|nr:hypothetical protein [Chroococcidiopsidaceae cyanobacterium CP_BM_ER_R8_30]